MKKKIFFLLAVLSCALSAVAMASGAGVLLAITGVNPETGNPQSSGSGVDPEDSQKLGGVNSITEAKGMVEWTDENGVKHVDERATLLSRNLMRKVREIFPANTPVAQILSYCDKVKVGGPEFEYAVISQRSLTDKLKTKVNAATPGSGAETTTITVENPAGWSVDDTIYFTGVKAVTKADGTAYDPQIDTVIPCLECKVAPTTKEGDEGLKIYAVNGIKNATGKAVLLPEIPAGAKMLRGVKTVNEGAAQTGRWTTNAITRKQFCRKMMLQLEETTLYRLSSKDVDWNMSRSEKMAVYDYKCAKEVTSLFGALGLLRGMACENNSVIYFSEGMWWMPSKDLELGHWDASLSKAVISDDNLVDFHRAAFTNTGIKSKRKLIIGGSDVIAEFGKVKSDKFRLMDTVEVWNLKFKLWETDFGEVLTCHNEFFDLYGMSDCALLLDPEHVEWAYLMDLDRKHLDLKAIGVRDAEALIFTEVGAPVLYYPGAHARVRLAQAPKG